MHHTAIGIGQLAFTSRDLAFRLQVSALYVVNTPDGRLEVFKVDTKDGFAKVGSIDHSPLLADVCPKDEWECRYYGHEVRRGVFADEYVYSISYGGVMVHDTTDMNTAVANVAFPYN